MELAAAFLLVGFGFVVSLVFDERELLPPRPGRPAPPRHRPTGPPPPPPSTPRGMLTQNEARAMEGLAAIPGPGLAANPGERYRS